MDNVLTRVWCQLQSLTAWISSLNGLTKFADRIFDAFYLLRCLMYIANYQKWKIVWNFCPCEAIPAYLKWTVKGNQKLHFLTNSTKKSNEHRGIAFLHKAEQKLIELTRWFVSRMIKRIFFPCFLFNHYFHFFKVYGSIVFLLFYWQRDSRKSHIAFSFGDRWIEIVVSRLF